MRTGLDDEAAATEMRGLLADALRDRGAVETGRVEAAIRAVPRHVFVRRSKPAATVEEAYEDRVVHTRFDASGQSISAVSQPTINALMLELADARAGMRVKEAGAGSGLFAAYLAHMAGEGGHVSTYDVDADIVAAARGALAAAGVANVTVTLADGATAHPDGAPYDRVVATVGAHAIPVAWTDELAPGGRLVVPLRIRGSISRAIAFEQAPDGVWRSVRSEMCTFMPLRGVAGDPLRLLALGPGEAITLQANQEQDIDSADLDGVFDTPRVERWTGVTFGGRESQEWLELYLTCVLPNALSRMTTSDDALADGLVLRRFGGITMATVEGANLAYLTSRPGPLANDGAQLYEVGTAGHGPAGDELATRLAVTTRTWHHDHRGHPARFETHRHPTTRIEDRPGRFVFDTPINRLVVDWQ